MRHKYETRGVVLSRSSVGEANALITFLTQDLGLVRARAQSVRKSGAKLAAALTTFTESNLILVRGKDGWRITGAVLEESWFRRIEASSSRARAARVSSLLLRLVAGESYDPSLFLIMKGFFKALTVHSEDIHEAIEALAALRVLSALGLDAGVLPGEVSSFSSPLLATVMNDRTGYIARINRGIAASGL